MKDQCYQFIKNEIGKANIVGFGSYGEVKIAKNTQNNQIVAIKLIHSKNAKQQIDVHHKLNHPNIIKLLNYYYQKGKNITYMVLQYAQNGSLNQKIKFGLGLLSKQLIKKYFKGVCQAVKYLHKHNYMHRDIKPENILITKDNIAKLCDFGFAAMFQSRKTMCGTFQYMAPEMIKKKHYTYKIDIWALGILLFEMIQGIAPFRGETGEEVINEMKKPIKFSQRFDSQQIDLIKKILRVNAENRPTVEQILSHVYLKGIKQDQKMNVTRNTVNMKNQIKQDNQMEQNNEVRQKLTIAKEEIENLLKSSNQKKPFKKLVEFTSQKSPYRQNHIKTQPTVNEAFINDLLNKSNKVNKKQYDVNNQQCQNSKMIQFRKIPKKLSPQSPKIQKKPVSPQNIAKKSPQNLMKKSPQTLNKLQPKPNNLNLFKAQKKLSMNSSLSSNINLKLKEGIMKVESQQMPSKSKQKNFQREKLELINKSNKQSIQSYKKLKLSKQQLIEIPQKDKKEGSISNLNSLRMQKKSESDIQNNVERIKNELRTINEKKAYNFELKNLKELKLHDISEKQIKTNVNGQKTYKYENIEVNSLSNLMKINGQIHPNHSYKYPVSKTIKNQLTNHNNSAYLDVGNNKSNDQSSSSLSQPIHLQKSVNSNIQSMFYKLK